jgi:hypothetical protein
MNILWEISLKNEDLLKYLKLINCQFSVFNERNIFGWNQLCPANIPKKTAKSPATTIGRCGHLCATKIEPTTFAKYFAA